MIPICSVGNPAKIETDEVVIAERRHIDLEERTQDSESLMVFLMKRFLCLFVFLSFSHVVIADESLPKTLMTQRGRLLASEDFTSPLTPATGTPSGFASGFTGWRFNKSLKGTSGNQREARGEAWTVRREARREWSGLLDRQATKYWRSRRRLPQVRPLDPTTKSQAYQGLFLGGPLARVSGGALKPEKLSSLDVAVKKAMEDGTILGATLWVERKGESYHRAWGQRTAQPPIEAMTEDTLFDVASITKVMVTTSSAMLCVERGLIGEDDLVSKHLPEFTGEGREKVTLRHLLLHSSGLPVNLNPTLPPFNNPADALAQACRTKLLFEPGSAFSYSSAGTMVLGAVIERVTGRKLDQFSTTEIFAPLRMTDTVFRPEGECLKRVAPTSSPARGLVDDTVARVIGGVAAHASLFTTTSDMARFARMMLNFGELNGVRIFQPETVKLMTSVQSPPGLTSPAARNLPVRRGLGWDIDTPYRTAPHEYTLARGALFPIGSYGHTGWTGQMLWIDPFSQTFVIFLCNRYVGGGIDTHHRVQQLHHRISTLAAEAVIGFDFENVVDALPGNSERESGNSES